MCIVIYHCLSHVQSTIEEGQELDLESLEYLVGRVIYGGRVLRAEDQRVISSILREILSLSLGRPALEEPPHPVPGEEMEGRGLAGLFPEVLGKLEDVQDFLVVSMCGCGVVTCYGTCTLAFGVDGDGMRLW